jgi:threonine/homoserine/homoserine lactone efflux protein
MLSYLALLAFVVFMVGTPGPANLIVMIVGAQFGLRRSAGFILGLVGGKVLLNLFIGFGFGVMLAEAPVWKSVFSYVSAGYMIFLAVRSWPRNAAAASSSDSRRHFGFLDGIVVHPLNPKAWVMSALAWGEFAPALGGFWVQLPLVVLTFAGCQLVLHSLWCWLGEVLGRSFEQNIKLTKLMIISTVAVVLAVVLY